MRDMTEVRTICRNGGRYRTSEEDMDYLPIAEAIKDIGWDKWLSLNHLSTTRTHRLLHKRVLNICGDFGSRN